MACKNRTSLHLALYESAYATTAKVVETVVSKIPEVGFKIPTGHVERVTKKYVAYLGFLVFLRTM